MSASGLVFLVPVGPLWAAVALYAVAHVVFWALLVLRGRKFSKHIHETAALAREQELAQILSRRRAKESNAKPPRPLAPAFDVLSPTGLPGLPDAARGSRSDVSCGAPPFKYEDMPPFPQRGETYYSEPRSAVCWFGILGLLYVSLATSMAAPGNPVEATLLLAAVWAQVFVANACLMCIYAGDPGDLVRTPQNALPIPETVEERLLCGRGVEDMENVSGEDGRTYCVRCLVWRPAPGGKQGKVHHCSTCQRCVSDFDHHCPVYGRCIAKGNFNMFRIAWTMAVTAGVTAVLTVILPDMLSLLTLGPAGHTVLG